MLLAPAEKIEGLMGMDLLQAAMNHHLGYAGVVFIAVVLFLFSFSTFLGILYYALLQRILRIRRYLESSDRIQDLFTDHALYRRRGSL